MSENYARHCTNSNTVCFAVSVQTAAKWPCFCSPLELLSLSEKKKLLRVPQDCLAFSFYSLPGGMLWGQNAFWLCKYFSDLTYCTLRNRYCKLSLRYYMILSGRIRRIWYLIYCIRLKLSLYFFHPFTISTKHYLR